MSTISAQITDQQITATASAPLVQGTYNVYDAEFAFDAAWDGLAITVIFAVHRVAAPALLDDTRRCKVPNSVMAHSGALLLSAVWVDGDGVVRMTTAAAMAGDPLHIRASGPSDGNADGSITPTAYDQLVGRITRLETGGVDWAQNDLTAPGYIQNRTHYEGYSEITGTETIWVGGITSFNDQQEISAQFWEALLTKKAIVTYDGAEWRFDAETSEGLEYRSSTDIVKVLFVSLDSPAAYMAERGFPNATKWFDAEVTYTAPKYVIKQLDSKFLPPESFPLWVCVDPEAMTASHTAGEIYEAVTGGRMVFLTIESLFMPVLGAIPSSAIFSAVFSTVLAGDSTGRIETVEILDDGSVNIFTESFRLSPDE